MDETHEPLMWVNWFHDLSVIDEIYYLEISQRWFKFVVEYFGWKGMILVLDERWGFGYKKIMYSTVLDHFNWLLYVVID